MDPTPFLLGKVLDDVYRIERLIGHGGMGSVFAATHLRLDCLVAIKIPDHRVMTDSAMAERFVREARALAKLQHPNIVRIHDVRSAENSSLNSAYIVMEYIDGATLAAYLRQRIEQLTLGQVLEIFEGIASAIDLAHEHEIIHRDIKPDNVLVGWKDGIPRLLDFGLARMGASSTLTNLNASGFTPAYASPEQCRGAHVTSASDVYSFAATVYYALAGNKFLFDVEQSSQFIIMHDVGDPLPLTDRNPSWPPAVWDILERGLAKKPEERPLSAGNLIKEIRKVLVSDLGKTYGDFFLHSPADLSDISTIAAKPDIPLRLETDATLPLPKPMGEQAIPPVAYPAPAGPDPDATLPLGTPESKRIVPGAVDSVPPTIPRFDLPVLTLDPTTSSLRIPTPHDTPESQPTVAAKSVKKKIWVLTLALLLLLLAAGGGKWWWDHRLDNDPATIAELEKKSLADQERDKAQALLSEWRRVSKKSNPLHQTTQAMQTYTEAEKAYEQQNWEKAQQTFVTACQELKVEIDEARLLNVLDWDGGAREKYNTVRDDQTGTSDTIAVAPQKNFRWTAEREKDHALVALVQWEKLNKGATEPPELLAAREQLNQAQKAFYRQDWDGACEAWNQAAQTFRSAIKVRRNEILETQKEMAEEEREKAQKELERWLQLSNGSDETYGVRNARKMMLAARKAYDRQDWDRASLEWKKAKERLMMESDILLKQSVPVQSP